MSLTHSREVNNRVCFSFYSLITFFKMSLSCSIEVSNKVLVFIHQINNFKKKKWLNYRIVSIPKNFVLGKTE